MSIDKSLISGSTATLILRLLEEKDMYGYEMIELLRQRSLESKGLLNSYESACSGKLRKYYQITKNGRRFLDEKKQEWKIYAQAVADVLYFVSCKKIISI